MAATILAAHRIDDWRTAVWTDAPLEATDSLEQLAFADPADPYSHDVPGRYDPDHDDAALLTSGRPVLAASPGPTAGNLALVPWQFWGGHGPTALTVNRDGVRSLPFVPWRPRIDGLWRSTARRGGWTVLWGECRSWQPGWYDTGFLVRPDGTREPLPLHPFPGGGGAHLAVRIDAEPGEYRIALHARVGGPRGWSEARRLTVLPAHDFDRARVTVQPAVYTKTNASRLQAAIDAMAAKGGGTVRLAPGLYQLAVPIVLRPGVCVRAAVFGSVVVERLPGNSDHVFFGADWAAVRGIVFRHAYGDGAYPYVFRGGVGRWMEVTDCTFVRCLLGEWDREGLLVRDCTFREAGANQLTSGCCLLGCRFEGIGPHPVSLWGARDVVVADCEFAKTDRGIVMQPHRGSVVGNLFVRNRFDRIDSTPNGNEHYLAEGARVTDPAPTSWADGAAFVRDFPFAASWPGADILAIKRLPSGAVECRVVAGFDPATGRMTFDRPFRSPVAADLAFAYGFAGNLHLDSRVTGSRGPTVLYWDAFAHGDRHLGLTAEGGCVWCWADRPQATQHALTFDNVELAGLCGFRLDACARDTLLAHAVLAQPRLGRFNQVTFARNRFAMPDLKDPALLEARGGSALFVDGVLAGAEPFATHRGVTIVP